MKSQEFSETRETNATAERHRALLALNNAIITNLTEETLLGAICAALKSVIQFDQAGLSIYEPEQEAMLLVALDGTSEPYFKLGQLLPLYDQVTGLSWEFHRQQFHPDLEHEIHHPIDQRIYDGGNRSYICAPLIHQGQACGTLGIGSRQKNQYTRDDLEFLQEVANQIALAVANMRAYAEIKALSSKEAATAEQRRVLLEINNAVINSLTQDDLLGAVCTAMKRAMPFDVGGLQLYEPEINALRVFSLVGDESSSPFAHGQLIPFKDGGSGQVLDFRRPQWERDLTLGRRHLIDQQIYDAGILSYCMAPLVLQEAFMGTLGIGSVNANQYSKADLEFLLGVANQIALAVANMRAYAEIKTLSARETAIAERHRTLLEINNAIITCLTQEDLLRSIGAALQRVVPFNQAGIYLYSPEKDVFHFFSLYRTDSVEPYIVEQELDPRDSVSGLVFARRQAMVRRDLETERQFSSEEHLYQKGVRSMCVAPLLVQGKPIGAIGLGSDVRNQYAEADAEFLQEVANQIALAVSNLRSYEEITALSRREAATAERRRTLLEINNAIATKLTQQELCDAVFAALGRIVPFDRVGLSLFDYEQDCYHIIALGGALGGQTQSESFTVGQRISRQENWITAQFNIGQPWFRPDLETVARNPFEQQLFSEGLRSFCAVPLLAQGKVIGAFSVSSQTRNQYSEADVELLQEVANQVAIAIANMQAYEEITALNTAAAATAERRRTLLEINNAIITNLTKESLLGAICQTLERVLPFDLAGINLYEPETGDLRLVAMEGNYRSDYFSVGQQLDLNDSCAGEAFTGRCPVLRRDMAIAGRYSSERHGVAEGFHSLCIVPLIAQGESIGCLALLGQKPNQYSSADAEFLQEVANQVALAIANMQAYEEIMALGEREAAMAERRRTLLEINNAIVTKLTQQDLCDSVFAALQRIIPFDGVGISLFDYEQDAYRIIAVGGPRRLDHIAVGQVVPRQENWVTDQFSLTQPMLRPDLGTVKRNPLEERLYTKGIRSFLAAPLLFQGKVIGALSVTSETRNQYSPADVELLQEVANQIALSLENSRLYEEMMQEAIQRQRTEEMLRAITEGTAAATGLDFFVSLARHLATALQIRFALVAECIGRDKGRVRTLAFWQGNRFGDNFEYDVTDTPCQGVIEGRVCYYPSNVQNQFPNDADLRELGAESYLGVTIFDTTGQAVGHLAVMDDKAMADDPWRVSVLKTFASRAGAELERLRAEMALRAALGEVESLKNRLQAENLYLQEEIRTEHNFDDIIGNSPALHAVLHQVEMIAPLDSTVLILGETGTGKELVARAIHDRSARKDRPLVKVNCGAISAGLVESELFGHVKGAFTGAVDKRVGRFELADGGTMFLDEVGELPMETQVKLLRVLQEGEFEPVGSNQTRRVNVRIIAATNRNLEEEIQKGRFRADLFYRLNVLPIQLPPLRQRMDDLPKLVGFFLSRFARKMGRKINGVSQETMERLKRYSWPGNVRELQNVIERAVALTSGGVLTIGSDLAPAAIHAGLPDAQTNGHAGVAPAPLDSLPLAPGASRSLEDVERDHILAVLNQTGWVVEGAKGAAKILSLNPNTLRSRMKKLGITRSNRHAGPTSI